MASNDSAEQVHSDISQLLHHVDSCEGEYLAVKGESQISFGHPTSPRLHLLQVSSSSGSDATRILIAYTKHCVSAQILANEEETEPVVVCILDTPETDDHGMEDDSEEEFISTLTAVILDQEYHEAVVAYEAAQRAEQDESHEHKEPVVVIMNDVRQQSSPGLLLRGVLSQDEPVQPTRIAVVVGTNTNCLYSVELSLQPEDLELKVVSSDNQKNLFGPPLFEVLPIDQDLIFRRSPSHEPFQPSGSVRLLSIFRTSVQEKHSLFLWVSYGDGTVVRLHHACLFPSIWKIGAELGKPLDHVVGTTALLRYKVRFQSDEDDAIVTPIPKFHPTVFSPLSSYRQAASPENTSRSRSAVEEPLEAFVSGSTMASEQSPTAIFYSSEASVKEVESIQRKGSWGQRRQKQGTASRLVEGVVGGALGALKWGLGRSRSFDNEDFLEATEYESEEHSITPFPTLWDRPVFLHAGHEYHDPARRLQQCIVDPGGNFVAATDNLGRVLLFCLATKQMVRLWKGYREAQIFWVKGKIPTEDSPTLFLLVHSRHRSVVETWSIHRHERVNSVQVGRDACILRMSQDSELISMLPSCYLVHSTIPGADNVLENLVVAPDKRDTANSSMHDMKSVSDGKPPFRLSVHRLQHLQQLLSSGSGDFSTQDIYSALCEVQTADLPSALDHIGSASVIEETLGVTGSDFHKVALAYCNQRLQEEVDSNRIGSPASANIKLLSRHVHQHAQIVKAYDILLKFDSGDSRSSRSRKTNNSSPWTSECMGWVATYERISGISLEASESVTISEKLAFSKFFSSCSLSAGSEDISRTGLSIYLSDSSRTRTDILVYIFSPLLGDVFSCNAVLHFFEALGIRHDSSYLLKCFGEYFVMLSKKDIGTALCASNPPVVRFLRELASQELREQAQEKERPVLEELFSFCENCEDLVRAFALASLCREALAKAAGGLDRLNHGKSSCIKSLESWERLLRKLRVCLLVSLRLFGMRFSAPVTVSHIDEGGIFSVYEWIAYDELSMSHNQQEIALLERSCAMSSYVFDPSTSEGDGPSKLKILQNSCLAGQISEEERAEYLVDFEDDDRFGALLLFLAGHNKPNLLAAHRCLLLAKEWIHDPRKLACLNDCFLALNSLENTSDARLKFAVCVEVWKTLAAAFRAHLFGFDDVADFREEVLGPLLIDMQWFQSFGRLSLHFLDLLRKLDVNHQQAQHRQATIEGGDSWPPVTPDHVVARLIRQAGRVDKSSIDTHSVVICALLVSKNTKALVQCVPAIYDCFLPSSLASQTPQSANLVSFQYTFVEEAVVAAAFKCRNKPLRRFHLDEIETLAQIWGIGSKAVRTVFLLAAFELDKDKAVSELLPGSSTQIDVRHFIEHGVDIVCRRLASYLVGNRLDSKRRRSIIGLVDADLVSWMSQRSKVAHWLTEAPLSSEVPISATRILVTHLLSLCSNSSVDPSLQARIHSLVVVTGILMRELLEST